MTGPTIGTSAGSINAVDVGHRVALESWVDQAQGRARVHYRGTLEDGRDLATRDPQLSHRGHWVRLEHPQAVAVHPQLVVPVCPWPVVAVRRWPVVVMAVVITTTTTAMHLAQQPSVYEAKATYVVKTRTVCLPSQAQTTTPALGG